MCKLEILRAYSIIIMIVKNINHKVIKKKYHVSEYKIKYLDENNNVQEIMIPNESREILDGHEIRKLAYEYISSNTVTKNPKIKKEIEKHGYCAFCEEHKELKRSHVVGNTVFSKLLKRSENGNAIRISLSSPKKVKKDNHSWAIEMLCSECEGMFNTKFEDYAISVLRGKNKEVKVNQMISGTSFNNIDQYRITLYVLSMFWRGAYSIDKAYDNFIINYSMSLYLKKCFKGEERLLKNAYSIRISKLYDRFGVFSEESIKDIIIQPFVKKSRNKVSYCIIFEGFLFEIYLLAQPFKERQKKGYLNPENKILFIPLKDIFSIEGIGHIFSGALKYKDDITV